ncbi:hypothetical protein FOMPIDRAFT_1024872 [Fomitopsis schrenkii]|uniref:Uncharacterized protein n=1 Tax=Fomitopsis schrenkii TaxID=2126942 RepID=S8E354_FOMSC|nr:hypothetical protein FOMPIDRAFT_1024872 [Fomitopsis schrenkii]
MSPCVELCVGQNHSTGPVSPPINRSLTPISFFGRDLLPAASWRRAGRRGTEQIHAGYSEDIQDGAFTRQGRPCPFLLYEDL